MIMMLDTNIISHMMKFPHGRVAERMSAERGQELVTSIVVEAELLYGIEKDGSLRRSQAWQAMRSIIEVLPFEDPAQVFYGRIRSVLERHGRLIEANDLLIAAHALSIPAVLITDNVREFERVPGLAFANWLRD